MCGLFSASTQVISSHGLHDNLATLIVFHGSESHDKQFSKTEFKSRFFQ